jgi:hypothetical protein
MATITSTSQLTMLEQANRIDPDGSLALIAEVLAESNPIIADGPYLEGNEQWGHRITRRAQLPSGSWRQLNKGVSLATTQTVTVTEPVAILESYSEIDKLLVDNSPSPEQFRMDEAAGIIEGLGQTLATTLIYGNYNVNPEQFQGLAPRLNDLDQENVIGAGGSGGDTTSIYIVQWGPRTVHKFFPRGIPSMGVKHEDKGQDTLVSGSSNELRMEIYRDFFQVACGLAVRDDRCIARIANIEVSGSSNIFDEDDLITLLNNMRYGGKGATIYVPRVVKTQMEIALKDKTNVWYTARSGEGLAGEEVLYFRGCPVKLCDAIIETETAVTS